MRTVPIPVKGNEITAAWGEVVANACNRKITGPGVTEHPTGYTISPQLPPDNLIRGRLTENLYSCNSADAIRMFYDEDDVEITLSVDPNGKWTFTLHDPLAVTDACLISEVDGEGNLYLPTGTCFYAYRHDDSMNWELLVVGKCCPGSGSGSDSGSGSGSGRGSGSGSGSGSGIGSGNCPCPPVCESCNVLELVQTGVNIQALCVSDNGQIAGWWNHSNVWTSPSGCAEPSR